LTIPGTLYTVIVRLPSKHT